jgi:maltose alpha-D-glucosyltransferase / alpha-amylase
MGMMMTDSGTWYRDAVLYEIFVRAFADSNGDGIGDLPGLIDKLDYLQELGVDTLWLLPITSSPLRDHGYDVSDYFNVHPDYGTLEDFRRLVAAAHRRGLRLVVELIPNHTSDQHAWFQASRDPQHPEHAKYRDWYVWSDTDQRYTDTRIIFLDTEPSNWTFDPLRKQYYWHRFFYHQPDLNYDHPEVQKAMLRVVQFWIDQGADGIRVDAPPYLYEREGTNCENLPETHAYLKRLRAFVEAYAPGTMLLSEANQWPEDVLPYFGSGDEFHMNFHFPLMPRIFMALAQADRTPLVEILRRTPDLPDGGQWATFLRCHDELTLEMVTPEERTFMWDFYAPEPRMRLNLGIRRRLAPLLDNDLRRIKLAHSLLLTFIGSPVIYYGDEIGMGDNIWLDDRDGVRTPMQWNAERNGGFSTAPANRLYEPVIDDQLYGYQRVNVQAQQADRDSLLNWLRYALRVRCAHPAFRRGTFDWRPTASPAIAAYWRAFEHDRVLVLHNLSDQDQPIELADLPPGGIDLLTQSRIPQHTSLQPYQFLWLAEAS